MKQIDRKIIRSRLLNGGFWAVLSRISGICLVLAANMMLTRLLPPADVGVYYISVSVIGLIAGIGRMGMAQAVVRLVSESMAVNLPGKARQAVFKAALTALAGGIVLALLYYFGLGNVLALSVFHSGGIRSIAGLISVAIVIFSVQRVVVEIYRGFHDLRGASLFGNALPQAAFAAGLAFLWGIVEHVNLRQVFIVYIVTTAVTILITTFFLRVKIFNLRGDGHLAYGDLLSIGWPLCLVNVAVFALTQADLWIVGAFLSAKDAAVYGSVQRLVMFMTLSYGLVTAVSQSSVAELHAMGKNRMLEDITQGLAFWGCVPAGILTVLYALWGPEILRICFGKFYGGGYWPLFILSGGQLVNMLFGPNEMVLAMTGRQKELMSLIVGVGVLTVPVEIFFGRMFGIIGVSTASAASVAVLGLCSWVLVYRKLGVKPHASIRQAAIAWRE